MHKKIDKQEVLNQIKICAMSYPLKALADDLDKPYSTLSNELDHREYAKLGFLTALSIVEKSQKPSAGDVCRAAGMAVVDLIEEGLGRIGYKAPTRSGAAEVGVLRLMARMAKEYGETVQAMAFSIEDGQLDAGEVERCLKENRELLRACLEADAYLKGLQSHKAGRVDRCRVVA
jgi:hypothetical protein